MYNRWRKASFSNPSGNCVETTDFRKTSYSMSNGDCIEVASGVAVRDTKANGAGPILEFSADAWGKFTSTIKAS